MMNLYTAVMENEVTVMNSNGGECLILSSIDGSNDQSVFMVAVPDNDNSESSSEPRENDNDKDKSSTPAPVEPKESTTKGD